MTTSAELPNPAWEPEGWSDPRLAPRPAGWLSDGDLAIARAQLPVVYLNAVPVQVDEVGDVISVGLLLRIDATGISRALVSGRVLYHERIRDALRRHIENDLGPMALPQIPASPQPFTVAEYLPTPGITPFHDPRQHAVSLAYVVPVSGDCRPRQDAITIDWLSPEEAITDEVLSAFRGGQSALVKQAMAWVGRLT